MMIETMTLVLIAFAILQVILFFKIWGMTNNVKEIRDYLLQEEDVKEKKDDNRGLERECIRQFEDGEIVLYIPENMKVKIVGYNGFNVYKCSSIDNEQTWSFNARVLKRIGEKE